MKKERFLGYLDALMDMAEACQFNEDQIPELIGDIRKKAEELDEPIETLPIYPVEPWWQKPWQKPWITYTTSWNDNKIELDNQSNSAYNIKYPEPNDWSVTYDKKNPTNFTVVK